MASSRFQFHRVFAQAPALTLLLVEYLAMWLPAAGAQTVLSIPPDVAPSSIGSDTTLNLNDGGVLGDNFLAGTTGDATNIEVNINGGSVGTGFQAGPADDSGGNVNVQIAGGTLEDVRANSGATVVVTGGEIDSVVEAAGGDVVIRGGHVSGVSPGYAEGPGGTFSPLGGSLHVAGGNVGGVSSWGGTDEDTVWISGGNVGRVDVDDFGMWLGGPAITHISGGTVDEAHVGDQFFSSSAGQLFLSGGTTNHLTVYDGAAFTMTGGQVGTVTLGSQFHSGLYSASFSFVGGTVGQQVNSNSGIESSLFGTSFIVNDEDITSSLTPGASQELSGSDWYDVEATLVDGSPLSLNSPDGFTTVTLLIPGDYDWDGDVDADDYVEWRQQFGSTGELLANTADGNFDGVVNAADYTVWRDNLGTNWNGANGQGTAVPEPSTLGFGLCGLAAVLASFRART